MKKHFLMGFAALVCGAMFTSCSNEDNSVDYPYVHLKVLTFEDEDWTGGKNYVGGFNWSSLIDTPQYFGPMLYPTDWDAIPYQWYDRGNTYLSHKLPNGWGDNAYWGGGHAVSNYIEADLTKGTYMNQLAIPVAAGHNGSKNFCVHNGFSSYSGAPVPALTFGDGNARVIDHMYVCPTTYLLRMLAIGDNYTKSLAEQKGSLWITATGYDVDGKVTGSVQFDLCKDGKFISNWKKFDLTPLGKVLTVEFDMAGTDTGTYGLNTPAYFAYDDVAVQI